MKRETTNCETQLDARPELDTEQFLELMFASGDIVALTVLGATFRSSRAPTGFYTDREALLAKAKELDGQGNVYININQLSPAVLERGENRFNAYARQRFSGDEILRRRTLVIDLDPERPSGTNSTNDELKLAIAMAKRIEKYLRDEWGVEPLVMISGNGTQLLYRIDEPTDSDIVTRVLRFLDAKFSDERVKVDTSLSDLPRITRLPGTLNMKGESTEDRPRRYASILMSPDLMEVVTTEQLESLLPAEPDRIVTSSGTWTHDRLRALLDNQYASYEARGWRYQTATKRGKGFDNDLAYELQQCPFVEHREEFEYRAMIWLKDGVPCFKCFSPDCDGADKKTFGDLLRLVAPELVDNRPTVLVTTNEQATVNQAVETLAEAGGIYQRGGVLVRIDQTPPPPVGVLRDPDAPSIVILPKPSLRENLTAVGKWTRETDDGPRNTHPPAWAVEAVYARSVWPVPTLLAIAGTPFLRADGTIADAPGYDEATGVYCDFAQSLPELPEARQAIGNLRRLVCDFPFESEEHAAAWIASVLTPLASHAFHGPAPLFLADANTPGSGKSLLMDLVSLITTGHTMPRMSAPSTDDEWRKRITSIAIAGEPLVLIDNVDGQLGSASLDAALTSETWEDRLLGVNRMVTMPLVSTWYATGNNVMLARDTTRRTLHIRLTSEEERPEERTNFTISNIVDHVRNERWRYVADALAVLSRYCEAGKPDMDLAPWGSFQGWSDLVRASIVWAGMTDPGNTRSGLVERSDNDSDCLRQLHDAWLKLDADGQGLTVAEVMNRIEEPAAADLRAVLDVQRGRDRQTKLVSVLRKYRERVLGGRMIGNEPRGNVAAWFVRQA